MFYKKSEYKLIGYQKSTRKCKKYDAILKHKQTGKDVKVAFGSTMYENFHDLTGLNLYKSHNDKKRRILYRARHKKDLRQGFYSPGSFSFYVLW